jgi:hypothetical protein
MVLSNQQERLIFLGTLIEGEGCVNLVKVNRPNGRFRLMSSIDINNTSLELVDFTVNTLKAVGISPYVHWKYQRRASDGMEYAPCACIRIAGMKRLTSFLEMIVPFLISKRKQAEIILAFNQRRLTKPQNAHYDEKDLELYESVKNLNKKPSYKMRESSETNTWDPSIYKERYLGDDRVQTTA